jgi:hypothetical protein
LTALCFFYTELPNIIVGCVFGFFTFISGLRWFAAKGSDSSSDPIMERSTYWNYISLINEI